MKTISSHLTIVLFVLVIALLLGGWQLHLPLAPAVTAHASAPVNEDACKTGRTVQVSGAAVINVVPDRALIQLGVESNGTTPDGVQNANFQAIQKVIRAVRALGIEDKDIATDYYIVMPVYESYSSLTIKGYRLDNTVSITVRDVNLADDVIIAALKAGANEVQDVDFYTTELRKFRDQARDLAMKAANEKAAALASAAGAQTGCIVSISENSWAQYYGMWRGGREATQWAQNVIQNAAPSASQPRGDDSPLSLGQIAVRAEVNASYSLK
jgi:hypothetical protein